MYRHTTPHPPSSLSALIPCGLSLRKQFMYCLDRRNPNALYTPETAKSVLLCLAWCLCFVNTIVVGAIPSKILTALPLLHGNAPIQAPLQSCTAAAVQQARASVIVPQHGVLSKCQKYMLKVPPLSKVKHQSESQWVSMVSGPTSCRFLCSSCISRRSRVGCDE